MVGKRQCVAFTQDAATNAVPTGGHFLNHGMKPTPSHFPSLMKRYLQEAHARGLRLTYCTVDGHMVGASVCGSEFAS